MILTASRLAAVAIDYLPTPIIGGGSDGFATPLSLWSKFAFLNLLIRKNSGKSKKITKIISVPGVPGVFTRAGWHMAHLPLWQRAKKLSHCNSINYLEVRLS